MDLKTPGSGEQGKNLFSNLHLLKPTDEIKFVVTDTSDWNWTRETIEANQLDQRFKILISPVNGDERFRKELAEKVLETGLQLRFQIQLHKMIWGDLPGT